MQERRKQDKRAGSHRDHSRPSQEGPKPVLWVRRSYNHPPLPDSRRRFAHASLPDLRTPLEAPSPAKPPAQDRVLTPDLQTPALPAAAPAQRLPSWPHRRAQAPTLSCPGTPGSAAPVGPLPTPTTWLRLPHALLVGAAILPAHMTHGPQRPFPIGRLSAGPAWRRPIGRGPGAGCGTGCRAGEWRRLLDGGGAERGPCTGGRDAGTPPPCGGGRPSPRGNPLTPSPQPAPSPRPPPSAPAPLPPVALFPRHRLLCAPCPSRRSERPSSRLRLAPPHRRPLLHPAVASRLVSRQPWGGLSSSLTGSSSSPVPHPTLPRPSQPLCPVPPQNAAQSPLGSGELGEGRRGG
ncbi:PREDICTED: vegetative cell wall protein gp1-like [Lepidothrix coronata]|uniref:Vegetative cell wall protein gp1-like n=1 Tax=Lepidothrix coronata TaxID=321398 RepID=A0A6J0HKT1_9PASS|nr:PREDICTED: vegetative cell wall protein gp1-like [Lepidothrix coronata]